MKRVQRQENSDSSRAVKKPKVERVPQPPQRPDRPMIPEDDPSLLEEGSLLKPHHIRSLKENGFCVVDNVADASFCEDTKGEWRATMESYGTGFKANDKSTWVTETLPWGIRGMQEWPPVAQEKYVWDTRLKALPVFAKLWNTAEDAMISSMDRVCFVPSTRLKLNKKTQFGWMHLDQASRLRRGNLECFQGFITLNDIGENEVALEVLAGAHRYHRKFFEECMPMNSERELKCKNKEWLKFTPEDLAWFEKQEGVKRTRVHAKAGALVLWDSRIPHHAMPPKDNAKRSKVDRYVIYTCMVPLSWTDEKTRKYRTNAFLNGRGTPHWPHDRSMFGLKPQTYGAELPCPKFSIPDQLRRLKTKSTPKEYEQIKALVGYTL